MLRCVHVLVAVLMAATTAAAQETPKFDAIVVRPHDPKDISNNGMIGWNGLAFTATNVPITFLMTQAFGVKKWLIEGLPPWASSMKWDFNAKVREEDLKTLENLSREERSRMLQTILTEQFGLRDHFELKVQPVYELTVLPGGPKFKPTTLAPSPADPTKQREGYWNFSPGEVKCVAITMAQFANGFSPLVERVIVDKTGLTGRYDLGVTWTPDDAPSTNEESHPGVFTAVREQMGLKLTPAKAPAPVLVIDALTQPDAQ